jgi:penicillin-binding protein 1C
VRRIALAVAGVVALVIGAKVGLRALPLPERLGQPGSTVILDAEGSPMHVFLSPDEKIRVAVTTRDVDPDFVRALVRFEDKRFQRHGGVDPLAIVRAAATDLRHGEVRSGGSTLTMQLVRILEPRPRTLRSKMVEAVRAVQLEQRLDKDEILAAYLTFAPYGRNVEGVEAASLAMFGHSAKELAPDEIATLLAIPQSPKRRFPSPENASRLRAARNDIARWLIAHDALPLGEGRHHVEPQALLAQVLATDVPAGLRPVPRRAAHAATWLAAAKPAGSRLVTTLDRGTQELVEDKLRRLQRGDADLGIHDAAVVVVDHRSGEVRALAGNFDFWEERPGAQIAGFARPRSPGSALKPFLYALAIDRGLVLPSQLVADIPVRHGTYAPENYDGTHVGLVRLDVALAWSLNVPFVDLLEQIGVEEFLGMLRQAGVASPSSEPGRYGLSAAIGGIEVTPLEVAGLYAMLAEGGRQRPLRVLRDEPVAAPRRVLSPGATWLTRQALSRRDRPDFPMRRQIARLGTGIHWKTGTSYGHRDAWAAGSGSRFTVVVWMGNLDNAPAVDLVGAEAAAPLMFDLLEALEPSGAPQFDPMPADLRGVDTCAYSGLLASSACPERTTSWALASHVPTTTCTYHVALDVDVATGLALNPTCRAGRTWETRTFLTWPAPVKRFLSEQHLRLPEAPPLDAACEVAASVPPRILLPPPGQVVLLMRGLPEEAQQVPLEADGSARRRHSWFVDGTYVGTTAAGERAWWTPAPGEHRVVVTDDTGASTRQELSVRIGG